ncbi:MAG: hypothetical protein OEV64_05245 [Desulfobulbaceae bacterium]|nr:hypothetical protein [Desulfobulbaceae bacterium]
MKRGETLRFIVEKDTVGRMDRVIAVNKGTIAEKNGEPAGVRYLVVKI